MSLARITAGFVGKPYQLGAVDCFAAILDYLAQLGIELPVDFEGYTRQSYAALYLSDPEAAKAMMIRLIDSLLPKVAPAMVLAGDLLLLRLDGSLPFLAIDGGNGRVLAATIEHGICQLPRNRYRIIRGWRCRQQSL